MSSSSSVGTPVTIYAEDPSNGVWATRWACEPPDDGETYIALREEWDADNKVRTIYEWVTPKAFERRFASR